MKEIQHISKICKSLSFRMTHGGFTPSLPIRRKGKATRFYIDNEYITWGYMKKLSKQATLVYFTLAKHVNSRTQACFPSLETILSESAICNRRYVLRGIAELEKYNLIFVHRLGKREPNNYYLLDTSVWKKISGNEIIEIPNVKFDNNEYQKEPEKGVEFATLNHRNKSYDEISIQEKETQKKTNLKNLVSIFKTNYKEEDIVLALEEVEKENISPGLQQVRIKLKELTRDKKIKPIKTPSW